MLQGPHNVADFIERCTGSRVIPAAQCQATSNVTNQVVGSIAEVVHELRTAPDSDYGVDVAALALHHIEAVGQEGCVATELGTTPRLLLLQTVAMAACLALAVR